MDDLAIYRVCGALSFSIWIVVVVVVSCRYLNVVQPENVWMNEGCGIWPDGLETSKNLHENYCKSQTEWSQMSGIRPAGWKKSVEITDVWKKIYQKKSANDVCGVVHMWFRCLYEREVFFVLILWEIWCKKKWCEWNESHKRMKEERCTHTHTKCENTPARTPYVRCGTTLSHFKPVIFHYVAVIRQFFIISYHMSYFKLFQVIFLYFKVI